MLEGQALLCTDEIAWKLIDNFVENKLQPY